MFLAMNRFKIAPGREADFVEIWKQRDTYLQDVPGFKSFNLMEGPKTEEYSLFVSHSVWESEEAFNDWTHSEAFRKAHANAGNASTREIYLGHPQLELFKAVI